jgi:hypothetical protein
VTFRFKHGDRPLDGYTIQRGVGRGGFGEVYYAISDGGREVALKALLLNHEIELRGVRQCINLKNPHLVSIFDVRMTPESMPFVIMEYVAGPSLREILRDRPQGLGRETAGYFLREIGRGLAYLHDRGIVHRDLKPENIFYEDGYVKIGDYGLSKYISVSRQSGQTMSVGTVHYMAPEIGTGIYNRGIDIYALGVILHELVTGRVPFEGDSFGEIIMKHLTAKPDLAGIEEPFARVIARALEKKPEDRYPTVDQMVGELLSEPSLEASVSVFNPAHLSLAGRREAAIAAPPAPVSPAAETVTFEAEARRAAANGRGAMEGAAYLAAEEGAAAAAVGLATPPHPGAGGSPGRALVDSPVPAPVQPRAARDRPAGDAALDPLDRPQRLGRAFFAGGLMTVIFWLLNARRGPDGPFAFACLAAVSAAAIIFSQTSLAARFQLEPGPWRRILAAAITAIPALVLGGGSRLFGQRSPDGAVFAYLLGMVLVDWSLRMNPRRDERMSIGSAFAAALPGLFLPLLFGLGSAGIVTGALLGTVSLLVNGVSPFVPHDRRRKKAPAAQPPPPAAGPVPANHDGMAAAPPAQAASPRRGMGHRLRRITGLGRDAPAARATQSPRLARHERPVRPFIRFIDYFLAAVGIGVTCAFLIFGLFTGEGIHAYTGAIISGAIGLFFLRQGLRERRGKIWADTLRPFLLLGSAATVAVCLPWIYYYSTWYPEYRRYREDLWVMMTLALVAGTLAYVFRPWPRVQPAQELAGPPERKVHLGWAAIGILLWMAGLASALVACAAAVGLGQALDLERELGVGPGFVESLSTLAGGLAINMVIGGAACVVVSRRRAGSWHILRAIAGQAALGLLLFVVFGLASEIHVARTGRIIYGGDEEVVFLTAAGMLALAAGGVILLVWPLRREQHRPAEEVSHA